MSVSKPVHYKSNGKQLEEPYTEPDRALTKEELDEKILEMIDGQWNEKSVKEQMKLDNYRIHLFNKNEDILDYTR